MKVRHVIETTPELARWYDQKYTEMGDGWCTPREEANRHLDALGVPFDRTKKLLDVGFGAGHFLAQAELRVDAYGIEISSVALRMARQRCMRAVLMPAAIDSGPTMFLKSMEGKFDFITSIGSLEHVIDIERGLRNIRDMLKPEGWWYFYCPNELWIHEDQPNERTMRDGEWVSLFKSAGLVTKAQVRWNDNTAFWGMRE